MARNSLNSTTPQKSFRISTKKSKSNIQCLVEKFTVFFVIHIIFVAWEKHVSDSEIQIAGRFVPSGFVPSEGSLENSIIPIAIDWKHCDPSVASRTYNVNDFLIVHWEFSSDDYNIDYAFFSSTTVELSG